LGGGFFLFTKLAWGDETMKDRKEVILTRAGLRKLEEELEYLKSIRRREVAERIKEAMGFGDPWENPEYDDAKNEQAFIEGRILTLEKMLQSARVIDEESVGTEEVTVGSKVRLLDLGDGREVEYTIVGSMEADPGAKKISNESPVGKAILGRTKGSVVEIKVPAGTIRYKILDISRIVS
jgi:transcription elongation factor GreA